MLIVVLVTSNILVRYCSDRLAIVSSLWISSTLKGDRHTSDTN